MSQTTAAVRIPDTVTVCVTSCARLDLLRPTVESFVRHNVGGTFRIYDDATRPEIADEIRRMFPFADVSCGTSRLGLMGAIDRLYGATTTPYIFHLEDDWEFDGPVNWDNAIALLERDPQISNVCVRTSDDMKAKYKRRSQVFEQDGQFYRVVDPRAHPEYHGWSSNPGLIRKALYDRFAPFGALLHDQMSARIKREGFRMAYQLPGVAHHIGRGRNVAEPNLPPRPKSKLGKLVRGFKKRLYYAGLRSTPF